MSYNSELNQLIIISGHIYDKFDPYAYIVDWNSNTCKRGSKMPCGIGAFSYCDIEYKKGNMLIIWRNKWWTIF